MPSIPSPARDATRDWFYPPVSVVDAAVAVVTEAIWDQEEAFAAGNILLEVGWDRMVAGAVECRPGADHRGHIDAVWEAFLGVGLVVGRGKVRPHEVAEECSPEDTALEQDGLVAVLDLETDAVAAEGIEEGIAIAVSNQ
jgi:hypothetical protein